MVGDDLSATKGFASMGRPRYNGKLRCAKEGARKQMTLLVAVLAVPVAALAVTSLALWYIAARTTLIIVVINALVGRFLGLINGVILGDFRHWFSLL